MLSHSAELLDATRTRPDPVVVRRFEKFCRLLADRRDEVATAGFLEERRDAPVTPHPEPFQSSPWRTGLRVLEQVRGRLGVG